jgi:preprotein translocase subunit SecE
MGLEILKKGQGRLARGVAYAMGALIVAFGALRLYALINVPWDAESAGAVERLLWFPDIPVIGDVSVYKIVALLVAMVGLLGVHLFLNREAPVDLLVDTEQEMRKVSWPSIKEVQNATLVVVLVTVTLSLLLAGFDVVLQLLFNLVLGGE